eukprot:scpid111498/ scgid9745/ 
MDIDNSLITTLFSCTIEGRYCNSRPVAEIPKTRLAGSLSTDPAPHPLPVGEHHTTDSSTVNGNGELQVQVHSWIQACWTPRANLELLHTKQHGLTKQLVRHLCFCFLNWWIHDCTC